MMLWQASKRLGKAYLHMTRKQMTMLLRIYRNRRLSKDSMAVEALRQQSVIDPVHSK